jgi:hypothetical protein
VAEASLKSETGVVIHFLVRWRASEKSKSVEFESVEDDEVDVEVG